MNNSLTLALVVFLLLLIGGNVMLFFIVVTPDISVTHSVHLSPTPSLTTIQDYLHHLSPQYKTKNLKYEAHQKLLYKAFNNTKYNLNYIEWRHIDIWNSDSNSIGLILHAMKKSKIVSADNAPKGTQLKLLLLLEDNQKLFFKPKRYNVNDVINGNIYAGFDRHNSEVLGYYLATVLNYKWVAPSVIRKVNIAKEIVPVATPGLQKTMVKKGHDKWCIYGKCYYCTINETVCGDDSNYLEGAAILYVDKPYKVNKSPWRRSYGSRKMEWETNDLYCKRVKATLSLSRLLDLVEVSIFDFLIQNGDRHRYEVYNDKIILLDNGKGLGNPYQDKLDILAPLYQCCLIRLSTWHHMELLSGGVLTQAIKTLASLQGDTLTTEDHYTAIERRLLTVYATVQMCIGRFRGAKVFK